MMQSTLVGRRRWLALIVLCSGMLMIILDATVVNVALPTIQSDLSFSQSSLAWVVNAYLIAFGGLLLLAGRLGDLIGRKQVFVTGLSIFTLASLLCGLAQDKTLLIGARFVQGVGGAMASAVILGMLVTMFTDPHEQTRAIGVYSFVASSGASIGLLVGGVLTEAINWHWIFFVNVPIGVAAVIFAVRLLPREQGTGLGRGADVPGALLLVAALMLLVYAIVRAGLHGWSSPNTLVIALAACALLTVFVVREQRAANPLMPLAIFHSRTLSDANLIQLLTVGALFGQFFLGALYMQRVLGYSAIQVGLAFLPIALLIGVVSLTVAPRLITRRGFMAALLPGIVSAIGGLTLWARAPVDGHYLPDLLALMLLLGVGTGLAITALMTAAMSTATPSNAGVISGLTNTTQQVGGALGLAAFASLSSNRSAHLVARGVTPRAALADGFHLAYEVGVGLLVLALLIGLVRLRPTTHRRAAATDLHRKRTTEVEADAIPEQAAG